MMEQRWIEPLDVLYLRGNRMFGGSDHAEALMPPWPSLIAGALRSRMLVDSGVRDFQQFANGQSDLGELQEVLGTPGSPGSLEIVDFGLGRQLDDKRIEPIWRLPADLVVDDKSGKPTVHGLDPNPLPAGVRSSCRTPCLAALKCSNPFKPSSGFWLSNEGMQQWLEGRLPDAGQLIRQERIWRTDPRLGIALDNATGTTGEGLLYTSDAVAFQPGHGFFVCVRGADGQVPGDGLLRLGGDGRGARISVAEPEWPEPDYEAIAAAGKMRLVLTSPGIFDGGWSLPGTDRDGIWNAPPGINGQLQAAAVSRAETVSGWDLARHSPKPALQVAPTGSVYWLDQISSDGETLRKLAAAPLELPKGQDERRIEGFNRFRIAAWPDRSAGTQ